MVEKHLRATGASQAGQHVAVFGGTAVGAHRGADRAQAGAKVSLVGYDGLRQRHRHLRLAWRERFGVAMAPADGSDDAGKLAVIEHAEVFAAGRAGTQIPSKAQLATARQLKVALDVNAVPPAGLEGIDAFADGVAIEGTSGVGVGALAVGNVGSRLEHELLAAMARAPRRDGTSACRGVRGLRGGMPPPEPVLICALSGRALGPGGTGGRLRSIALTPSATSTRGRPRPPGCACRSGGGGRSPPPVARRGRPTRSAADPAGLGPGFERAPDLLDALAAGSGSGETIRAWCGRAKDLGGPRPTRGRSA
ncbi:MAG: hypothetical protein U1E52_09295 [Geminicoccaceae bacterium]